MATGAPDWQSPVTIALQTLATLIIRSTVGATRFVADIVTCPGSSTTTIFDITGQGLMFMSGVYLDDDTSRTADYPELWVDGNQASNYSLGTMRNRRLVFPYPAFEVLSLFDDTLFDYGVVFSQRVTFESSLKLKYTTGTPDPVGVQAWMWYSLL